MKECQVEDCDREFYSMKRCRYHYGKWAYAQRERDDRPTKANGWDERLITLEDPPGQGTQWLADAACQSADPEAFFQESGFNVGPILELCNRCPVREPCLEFAIHNGLRYGIWGGTTPTTRWPMVQQRRRDAQAT